MKDMKVNYQKPVSYTHLNNIYAENSQMLNERNNQMTYQNLFEQQESIKNKKTNKKQSIPTYEEGTYGVSGRKKVKLKYIYDPVLGGFGYIDPNTGCLLYTSRCV